MAALTITAANVAWVSGPTAKGVAGEAFTAGDAVYKTTSGTWSKATHSGTTTQAGKYGIGVALATADAAGAQVVIALPGAVVDFGSIGTAGLIYAVGDTAGDIIPSGDLAGGDHTTLIGLHIGSGQIKLVDGYHDSAAQA